MLHFGFTHQLSRSSTVVIQNLFQTNCIFCICLHNIKNHPQKISLKQMELIYTLLDFQDAPLSSFLYVHFRASHCPDFSAACYYILTLRMSRPAQKNPGQAWALICSPKHNSGQAWALIFSPKIARAAFLLHLFPQIPPPAVKTIPENPPLPVA